jgi:Raf kinase inhibitor-like YbhB/YbcL family protein
MAFAIEVSGFGADAPIPGEYAFCIPSPTGHAMMGGNRNPRVAWSGAPDGTRSFVLICVDADAPTVPDAVNQPGMTVPASLPRAEFAHWLLVDIPASVSEIPEGADSSGVTPRGKSTGAVPYGVRGRNDYTDWFAGDTDMAGTYGGYDGPCPPWNDERIHRYTFTVAALDIESLGLADGFRLPGVRAAMEGHVLAEASMTATYTLNPALGARPD